jgi:NTP pyrophosphatase (non-canonical NTP hydrolase)
MGLFEMQKEVFENKKKRSFNITDVGKEIILMTEELGELAKAYKNGNKEQQVDAVGDIMVYCLGLCEILGVNSEELLRKIIDRNKTRTHTGFLKE